MEEGTLGLFVTFKEPEPNAVRKEPAKKMLVSEELVVMELTRDCAPEKPWKGGGFHD